MDPKIQHPERIEDLSDFLVLIKELITGNNLPVEKALEIKKHLDNGPQDYHSLQAITDILESVPTQKADEVVLQLQDQFRF